MRFPVTALSALVLSLVATAQAPQPPQGPSDLGPFDQCGELLVASFPPGCVLFVADDGYTYAPDTISSVPPGGRVRLIGTLDPFACGTLCSESSGCIVGATFDLCPVGEPGCFGDGDVCASCPCGNDMPMGTETGCLNSSGTGAVLRSSGSSSLSRDELLFFVEDARPDSFAMLASSSNLLPSIGPCAAGSGVPSAMFDGLRCLGTALTRHGMRATDDSGAVGYLTPCWGATEYGLAVEAGATVGQSLHFQVFYRDDPAAICQTGQNTTNVVSITIQS